MKKLFIVLLLTITASLYGQKNTAYVVFHPTDMGVGIRYDRQIANYGTYVSATKGKYCLGDYTIRHEKAEIGLSRYFRESFISAGISHHWYEHDEYKPISLNLSVGVNIEMLRVIICMDPVKWEGGAGLGIRF